MKKFIYTLPLLALAACASGEPTTWHIECLDDKGVTRITVNTPIQPTMNERNVWKITPQADKPEQFVLTQFKCNVVSVALLKAQPTAQPTVEPTAQPTPAPTETPLLDEPPVRRRK